MRAMTIFVLTPMIFTNALAQSIDAGWWTQIVVRECGPPRTGETYPDCGDVQSELRINETDLGLKGSADSAFIQAQPLSQSVASTGYTGQGFTPAISAYSYSALGQRTIASAIGLQRYEFLSGGDLRGRADFTYSQFGIASGLPFFRSPVGFLQSGIIIFQTANDLFEPENCGIEDTSRGVALLVCLINESASQTTNAPGRFYAGARRFRNFELDDFEYRPSTTTQTVWFNVIGNEGDVFFLTADMFIFANNGGYGDSRTTLKLTFENPELVEAAFQDETFKISPPPSIGIDFEIVPGSDENRIILSSRGLTSTAIMGSDIFDVTQVDVLTVRLGPGAAPEAHGQAHIEDINDDGKIDLILHFETQAIGLACGDTGATIEGETFGGQPFIGVDAISPLRCE